MSLFTTPRLSFRPFVTADLEQLAVLSADPIGSRYVGDGQPLTRAQTAQWIHNSTQNIATHGYGTGAVSCLETDRLIGWAGIARPGDGTEEVIYGLGRDYWGQGYGTELLGGLIQWAREDLCLPELRATVDPANEASIQMLRNAGFELRKTGYGGDPDSNLYCLPLNS